MGISSALIVDMTKTSFNAMLKIFFISCVGIVLAKYPKSRPIIPKELLGNMSKLSASLFVPCLIISSLGSTLSVDVFFSTGMLALWGALIIILSLVMARLTVYCIIPTLGDDASESAKIFQRTYSLILTTVIAYPNTISLPILIMQTLCDQPLVNDEFKGDSQVCFSTANSMLFIVGVAFHLLYWSFGVVMLKSVPSPTSTSQSDSLFGGEMTNLLLKSLMSPAMIGIYLGSFIGLITPVRYALFESETIFRSIGSTISVLGSPTVAVNCLVLAASLGHVELHDQPQVGGSSSSSSSSLKLEETLTNTSTTVTAEMTGATAILSARSIAKVKDSIVEMKWPLSKSKSSGYAVVSQDDQDSNSAVVSDVEEAVPVPAEELSGNEVEENSNTK